jgi:hypothetical protein
MKTKIIISKVRAAQVTDNFLNGSEDEFRCIVSAGVGINYVELGKIDFGDIRANEEGYTFSDKNITIDWESNHPYGAVDIVKLKFIDTEPINIDTYDIIGSLNVLKNEGNLISIKAGESAEGPDGENKFHLTGSGGRYWIWIRTEEIV